MAEADVIEVEVRLEGAGDGEPIIDELNGRLYCRLSWARGAGPPACRGIYVWTSDDYAVLYIGKATSDRTSHLYRRITAYKRASPGKTQWTSLRLNSEILRFVQSGGRVRLVCLAMPNATADDVTRAEIRLIDQARPPWNRRGNLRPRTVEDAMSLIELLDAPAAYSLPKSVALPL